MSYSKLNCKNQSFSQKEECEKIFYEKQEDQIYQQPDMDIDLHQKQTLNMIKKISIHQKQNIYSGINFQNGKDHSEDSSEKHNKNSYKSPYHNLQKHTVTTILQIVTIRKTKEDSLSEQAAYEMWRIFLKSNVKTKKVLSILYGREQFNETTRQRFIKSGFQNILNQYSENTIINAQNILREMTVEQMTEEKVKKNLKHRHVTNQQNLLQYISKFVEQLRNGPIKLRIDDKTSKSLQQNFITLNQEKLKKIN